MSDAERIAELETVLAQFLKPIRNIPFPLVIKAVAEAQVIPMSIKLAEDRRLVEQLSSAAIRVGEMLRADPIRRNRPNEVGNDVEPFVMKALAAEGLRSERPRSSKGRGQQVGYPDILLHDDAQRPTYLECKVFGEGSAFTTMRSFYLSPSENFKVCVDARHLLMAFAVARKPIGDSRDSFYSASAYKLIDLHGLKCDVKCEFNSDNLRLYHADLILAEGVV